MTSESTIKSIAPTIFRELGRPVTKREVINWFFANYPLDDDDKEFSKKRPGETMFEQRVGNIICHRDKRYEVNTFPEGISIKKDLKTKQYVFFVAE